MRNQAAACSPTEHTKEKRLLLVAQKAGALEAKAMSEGNRDRAYHFMRRMYRLLHVVASMRKQKEATRG